MIRGVIFDLGSTLIYFDSDWPEVAAQARARLTVHLRQHGLALDEQAFQAAFHAELQAHYQERESEFVEVTTAQILREVLARFGHPAPSADLIRGALETMYRVSEAHWQPVPRLHEVLLELKRSGLRLGLVSNAGDEANVQRLIDGASLRGYLHPIMISAALGLRKPNPAVFRAVLDAWGLDPEQVVMVGDTLGADILGAQHAGLHQIWMTAYADTPANRAHAGTIIPEASVAALTEVPDVIRQLSNHTGSRKTNAGL